MKKMNTKPLAAAEIPKQKGFVNIEHLFKIFVVVGLMLFFLSICFTMFREYTDVLKEHEAQDGISEGVVVKHEYLSGYVPLIGSYVPERYRLHIEGTYEFEGETHTAIKYYDVSKEAYAYFKDGDYFNSATFMLELEE